MSTVKLDWVEAGIIVIKFSQERILGNENSCLDIIGDITGVARVGDLAFLS